MTTITFYPENHTYVDNLGRNYISVTQLLKRYYPFDEDMIINRIINLPNSKYYKRTKEDIIKEWREISEYGNLVHKTIENYINHKQELLKEEETYNCLKQFKALGFDKCISEKIVFNEKLLIAGSCDLIIDMGEHYEIWDIKTNNKMDPKKLLMYSLQLNFYKYFSKTVLDKPVKLGGILWFDNFYKNRSKTKMKIIKPVDCLSEFKNMLQRRINELKLIV